MDVEIARVWLQLINIAGTALVGAWMYIEKRNDKTNERIDELNRRFEELDKAVRTMRADATGNLRHDDLQDVYGRLNSMDGKLSQLIGEFRFHSDTLKLFLNKITEKGLQ
jgi:methyl-accepting chemotaxis protein